MNSLPLRLYILFSGGASAALRMFSNDAEYKIVGACTNNSKAKAIVQFRERGITPDLFFPDFRSDDTMGRRRFYEKIKKTIEDARADLVVCSGWIKRGSIITDPLLSVFRNRILNSRTREISKLSASCITLCKIYSKEFSDRLHRGKSFLAIASENGMASSLLKPSVSAIFKKRLACSCSGTLLASE